MSSPATAATQSRQWASEWMDGWTPLLQIQCGTKTVVQLNWRTQGLTIRASAERKRFNGGDSGTSPSARHQLPTFSFQVKAPRNKRTSKGLFP